MRARKKLHTFFFSLLVLAYITSNTGVFIYYHYCGGELEKISAVKVKSCCGGMDEKDGGNDCCKNESRHLSLKPEFSPAKSMQPNFSLPAQDLFTLLNFSNTVSQWPVSTKTLFYAEAHPPGPIGLTMVQTSVFRI